MGDNLKNPITLAGELLLLRMFDNDEKADETIRQSAIQLRQLFEEVGRLREEVKRLKVADIIGM